MEYLFNLTDLYYSKISNLVADQDWISATYIIDVLERKRIINMCSILNSSPHYCHYSPIKQVFHPHELFLGSLILIFLYFLHSHNFKFFIIFYPDFSVVFVSLTFCLFWYPVSKYRFGQSFKYQDCFLDLLNSYSN